MKKIRGSIRGLTFSLDDVKKIGTKFRYIIDKENSEIIIIPDKDGRGTVSRKKVVNISKLFMIFEAKL